MDLNQRRRDKEISRLKAIMNQQAGGRRGNGTPSSRGTDSVNYVRLDRCSAMAMIIAAHLGIAQLRGYWPFTSVDENYLAYDMSQQARHLSASGSLSYEVNGLCPDIDISASGGYLYRANETGIQITGALSWGGWLYLDNAGAANDLMSKYNTTANQRGYRLANHTTGAARVTVSSNGTATTILDSTNTVGSATWAHFAATYNPSTQLAVYLNGVETVTTTSIPAAIYNSSANLLFGGANGASNFSGKFGQCWLAASVVSPEYIKFLYDLGKWLFV